MFHIRENTNINTGLNNEQVLLNKRKYGSNTIAAKKKDSFFKLFLESLGDPIIKILLIALAIKVVFLFKDYYETIGIVIAILLASLISSISEYGSEKAFERLQEESSRIKCKVRRNGVVSNILLEDVVVGDIILLESGDKIPADGVLISGELKVDESSMTGESKEVKKEIKKDVKLYRGTVVTAKDGEMLVTSVGEDTFFGKVANELKEKQPESPLKLRLRNLAKVISVVGYIGAFLVAFSYLFKVILIDNNFNIQEIKLYFENYQVLFSHLLHALTLAVTIIVVAVPEGLPMMITLVLSSNMKRMLKNNVLVRKLTGIETAGSLNILFSDKTGTITKGNLEVVGFLLGNGKYYNKFNVGKKFYNIFLESLIYNTASKLSGDGKIIGGNTTDKSILEYIKEDVSYEEKIVKEIPFDSKNKFSLVELENKNIYIKGASEVILPLSNEYFNEIGEKEELKNKDKLIRTLEGYASKGMRLIAVGKMDSMYKKKITLIGFLVLKDEIRNDAVKGLKLVKDAGIQTVMITGDNKNTALAIAKEVGLVKGKEDIVLTSLELSKMSDEEVKKIIPKLRVVARSLPQDKSRLIRLSQELDLVVGMTGDGVNDAPALKKADVGFAMGSGTEVAKEASDIVVLDDNFLSISSSVLFGRTIFKSIRKFIIFQLTVNLCAISLSIIGPFIGVETPVTVIQMLWVNMVMDTLAGLAFAFEPPLIEYMKEKPKKRGESIINKYMVHEIFFTGAYSSLLCILFLKLPIFKEIYHNNISNEHLLTAFFGLFIFVAIFNSFNARTHRLNLLSNLTKNKVFILITLFIIFVQLYLIYFGGHLFRTTGLSFLELEIMIILAFTVVPVDFIRKIFLRKKGIIGGV